MRRLKTVRRPPIYPKTPGHLPCSSLTHPLPLSSRRPSVSFGGFGLNRDPDYIPVTQTIDQLQQGKRYELVLNSLQGMPFLRYRTGQLVRVDRGSDTSAELPLVSFEGRTDGLIDIAGFTRLNERTIQEAIQRTGLDVERWRASTTWEDGNPKLLLDLHVDETKSEAMPEPYELMARLHDALKLLDPGYDHLESMLGIRPLKLRIIVEPSRLPASRPVLEPSAIA